MKQSNQRNTSNKKNQGEAGSVTIFFVIIFLCIIMLTGSMIDLSRIMVADNKLDSAMRAATKSLMAEYDEDMVASYGIFVNETEENKEVFQDYLRKNLELSSNGFMNYQVIPDSVKVVGDEHTTLKEKDILQNQINAYMEAKAPINSGIRIGIRAMDVLEVVLDSDYAKDLTEKKESDVDELLNKDKSYALKTGADNIGEDTPQRLEEQARKLDEELKKIIQHNNRLTEELTQGRSGDREEGPLADLEREPGGSFEEMEREEDTKAVLIKTASAEIKKMQGYAQNILRWQDALEAEQDKEEPDQDTIDRLTRQIREEKEKYEKAQVIIGEKIEDEELKPSGGQFSWDQFAALQVNDKLNISIPALASGYEEEGSDPGKMSLLGKLSAFQQTVKTISGGLTLDDTSNKYRLVEYIMDRCTYATSDTERNLSQFKYGEVEYLLNGSPNQATNLFLAFGKIFLFCYALNVLDLCLNGVPLWPTALVVAIVYTAVSIKTIYTGGKYVPLELLLTKAKFKGIKEAVGLSYSDLIYIQLVMTNENHLLSRLRRLMVANLNGSRSEQGQLTAGDLYTRVNTEAQASVNLLFLPMLPLDSLQVSGFKDDRYTIKKAYSFSYE